MIFFSTLIVTSSFTGGNKWIPADPVSVSYSFLSDNETEVQLWELNASCVELMDRSHSQSLHT